ncbi:MAG: ACP S-malonyltransferase [Ruminococcus sp.]|jgi:[acyl-carrier-protein] S-malonyltransferase|nr:ACP S-malonyltransferase [Ruminococcus sp.]
MSKTVFLFPGQGSQAVGMGVSEAENNPELAQKVFSTAKNALGYDLFEICKNESEKLAHTLYAQPAIAAVSVLAADIFEANGVFCDAVAGHSLGEYPAMYKAGVISLFDMFALLKIRAEAMEKAAKTAGGVMYAVIGASSEDIENACKNADGYVVPVNYNSSAQIVIAGEEAAAEKAVAELTNLKAKCIKLGVSAAFHSELMRGAYDEFREKASGFVFKKPEKAFYSNLTGDVIGEITAENLALHIISPVRFSDELQNLQKAGYDTFAECGPGKTLSGFVKKTLKGVNIL